MSETSDLDRLPLRKSREHVIELLKSHYANDTLKVEEFERRVTAAENSKTYRELVPLIADLPELPEKEAPEPGSSLVAINRGAVKESSTIFNLLSGTTRRGPWKPARWSQRGYGRFCDSWRL
jgi:hypothetical protein